MCWRSGIVLLALAGNALAAEGYIIGLGVEGDNAEGLSASLIGDLALTEHTWLNGSIARTQVDLPRMQSIDTWYGDLGIDHWFDPAGIRLGVAYWGDSDILHSRDSRASLYWRGDKAMLAGDFEYRDFRFELPATDFFPGRTIRFDASGTGLSARFNLTDKVSLGLHGMDYDYSVNLRLDSNRGLLDLFSFSRLSLINSLVDYRAGMTLGLDAGKQHWQLGLSSQQVEVDGSTTRSATLRLLTPMGERGDVEFSVGVDSSDLYDTVTFLSVFLYFYGGS
jgi:hypothetical protein